MHASGFSINQESYAGPFELLFTLVSQRKVDIFEVRLDDIINQYLGYIEAWVDFDLDSASEFLEIAAILLHIKARGLVGTREEPEAEAGAEEPLGADVLESRLAAYRVYKEAALALRARLSVEELFFSRSSVLEPGFERLVPDFTTQASPGDLLVIYEALARRSKTRLIDSGHIAKIRVSIESMLDMLSSKLGLRQAATFRELTGELPGKEEVIAAFLALLQLVRRGDVGIRQAVTFGDIEVTWLGDKPR